MKPYTIAFIAIICSSWTSGSVYVILLSTFISIPTPNILLNLGPLQKKSYWSPLFRVIRYLPWLRYLTSWRKQIVNPALWALLATSYIRPPSLLSSLVRIFIEPSDHFQKYLSLVLSFSFLLLVCLFLHLFLISLFVSLILVIQELGFLHV